MESRLVDIRRRDGSTGRFEIKDPTVVQLPDGTYALYATVFGVDEGLVPRFTANHPAGPWQEEEPAVVEGVSGPGVCAPSVVVEDRDGEPLFRMYIQTSWNTEDGVIAVASSTDGIHFKADPVAMTKKDVPGSVSLYDVAVSEVTKGGKIHDCMVFSAYREVGCGDVYVSLREQGTDKWSAPKLALKQEDVPFHNQPGSKNFEWGLEGAKIVQLADDAFLMVGVCFLDKDKSERGTRQRVFFAASATPDGPFLPMRTPIEPTPYKNGSGENGHPETIDLGDKLGILYQERAGEGRDKPWHLRYTEFDKTLLLKEIRARLAPPPPSPANSLRGRRSGPKLSP